jgi:hypothetical protein
MNIRGVAKLSEVRIVREDSDYSAVCEVEEKGRFEMKKVNEDGKQDSPRL